MLSILFESIASTLAEHLASKYIEKGMTKAGKARGWIALGVLVLLVAFLVWLGVYLLPSSWVIGILMFIIAAAIVYLTIMAGYKNRRGRR